MDKSSVIQIAAIDEAASVDDLGTGQILETACGRWPSRVKRDEADGVIDKVNTPGAAVHNTACIAAVGLLEDRCVTSILERAADADSKSVVVEKPGANDLAIVGEIATDAKI